MKGKACLPTRSGLDSGGSAGLEAEGQLACLASSAQTARASGALWRTFDLSGDDVWGEQEDGRAEDGSRHGKEIL